MTVSEHNYCAPGPAKRLVERLNDLHTQYESWCEAHEALFAGRHRDAPDDWVPSEAQMRRVASGKVRITDKSYSAFKRALDALDWDALDRAAQGPTAPAPAAPGPTISDSPDQAVPGTRVTGLAGLTLELGTVTVRIQPDGVITLYTRRI